MSTITTHRLHCLRLGALVALLALLGGAVTGCSGGGDSDDGAGAPTSDPQAETGTDTGTDADPGADAGSGDTTGELPFGEPRADEVNLLLESEDDLDGVAPAEILDVRIDDDDPSRVVLSFEMGSHHCHGVQLTVDESPTEVSFGLASGRLPGVAPTDCGYGVFPYTTAAQLAAPVGTRTLAVAEQREPTADTGNGGSDPADGSTGGGADGGAQPIVTGLDAEAVIGHQIEDGIEWAEANGVEWRLLRYDGESMVEDDRTDPERLSFVVERDVIVAYEWS